MSVTNIFYYVPEDNEDINQLNTFTVHKPINDVTLKDIKKVWLF